MGGGGGVCDKGQDLSEDSCVMVSEGGKGVFCGDVAGGKMLEEE